MVKYSKEAVIKANRIHVSIVKEVLYSRLTKEKAEEIIREIESKLDDEIVLMQASTKEE